MGTLNRKSGYFSKVRQSLIKLADIIDPDGESVSNDSFYDDVSDSIEKIADNYSNSPLVLPSVTSEDSGKVLTVINGAWSISRDSN